MIEPTRALQQVHYLLTISKNEREGRLWTYRSVEEWRSGFFPFWGEKTIRRAITRLTGLGVLLTGEFNRVPTDRTTWYSIDYEALEGLLERGASGQSDQVEPVNATASNHETTEHENDDPTVSYRTPTDPHMSSPRPGEACASH